jgi:Methyltransferase domain
VPERTPLRRVLASTPWRLKIAAKLVLSRLHLGYGFWSRLSLFKHGSMDDPAYAEQIFLRHFGRVATPPGFVVLELGPGDTAFSAVIAHALGASRTVLVDVGPFARRDVELYRKMACHLADRGLPVADLEDAHTFEEVLERCSASYLTGGVDSLRTVPDDSVNLSFSHAVLEHVRAAELPAILRELRRVTAPSGGSSHLIDLEDHLAHALNSLRFSDRIWESHLFASSGFYTNRFRKAALLEVFADAGFDTQIVAEAQWPELPTPRSRLAPQFRAASNDDLLVHSLEVVLRPRGGSGAA